MQFIVLLLAVGLVVRYWWLVAAVVGMIVAAYWARLAVDRHLAGVAAQRRRLAGLAARADRQHNWVMQGDPRGTYGDEYPAVTV
jgi:hypothetical protein